MNLDQPQITFALTQCVESSGFNPIWFVVLINALALIAVPYLTYRYSHIINLKSMKEKWIAELRDLSTRTVEVSEQIFRASEQMYDAQQKNDSAEEERARLERSNLYSKFTSLRARVKLLFKEEDSYRETILGLLNDLQNAAEKTTKSNGKITGVNRTGKDEANELFAQKINEILRTQWQEIQKLRFWANVFGKPVI